MYYKKILVRLIFLLPVRSWFEIVIRYLAFSKCDYILLVTEDAVEYNLAFAIDDR